jgi:hypoxanthine phosphoribosyltransferase
VAGSPPAAILTWEQLTQITTRLARAARADTAPATVVGVLRGGMIPAVHIAHLLGVRDMRALDVTHTLADGINAAKAPSPVLRNLVSLGDLTGCDVLLVDDIAGTGETLAASHRLLRAAGAARVRTAACAVNEVNWHRASERDPGGAITYIGASYQGWVVFPWEQQ